MLRRHFVAMDERHHAGQPPSQWVWLAAKTALLGVVALASVPPVRRALMVSLIAITREND